VNTTGREQAALPAILAAFGLGSSGRLSDGPVATGRVGAIWRLVTDDGAWAVKLVTATDVDELVEILEGAAFQEAARRASVPAPKVRRTTAGDLLADLGDLRAFVQDWVDMAPPAMDLDPVDIGGLVARLHLVPFRGSIGVDDWYAAPVGARRWTELLAELRARRAPFAEHVETLMPETRGLEALLGGPPRTLRTCHRDLWADNVRRTPGGGLCVFDFDNSGLADPSQELAAMLVEYAGADPKRARAIRAAYADAGGPGRVTGPADFAMAIAQLTHILEAGCRGWLAATTDADRADNEAWVHEYLDRPLTMRQIEALLS
jgi:Ser/Thr protein kinase RdoA (MazF antagonist)